MIVRVFEVEISSEKELKLAIKLLEYLGVIKEELSEEEIRELEEIAKACEEGRMKTYSVEEAKKSVKNYVCPICGKTFTNGLAYGGHLRWCKTKSRKVEKEQSEDFDLKKMFLEEKKVMDGILK